jgi:hypothetical protein
MLIVSSAFALTSGYVAYLVLSRLVALRRIYSYFRGVPSGLHLQYTHPQFFLAPVLRHYPQWDVGDYRAKGLRASSIPSSSRDARC